MGFMISVGGEIIEAGTLWTAEAWEAEKARLVDVIAGIDAAIAAASELAIPDQGWLTDEYFDLLCESIEQRNDEVRSYIEAQQTIRDTNAARLAEMESVQ